MSRQQNSRSREMGLVCGWTFNVLAGFAAIIGFGYVGGQVADWSDLLVVGLFVAPFPLLGSALRYLFAGDIGWPFTGRAHY